jgi:hypothetical protein
MAADHEQTVCANHKELMFVCGKLARPVFALLVRGASVL